MAPFWIGAIIELKGVHEELGVQPTTPILNKNIALGEVWGVKKLDTDPKIFSADLISIWLAIFHNMFYFFAFYSYKVCKKSIEHETFKVSEV